MGIGPWHRTKSIPAASLVCGKGTGAKRSVGGGNTADSRHDGGGGGSGGPGADRNLNLAVSVPCFWQPLCPPPRITPTAAATGRAAHF